MSQAGEAMKKLCFQICATLLLAAANSVAFGQAEPAPQAPVDDRVSVTPDNFNRAETDILLGSTVKDGGFGKLVHHRELYPIDAPIVRPNRDTLYSFAVFDLDAGPVTITLPDAGRRFIRPARMRTDRSPFNSAAAMAKSLTACRLHRAGIIGCGSIGRALKS
jgi:hypothetical protein